MKKFLFILFIFMLTKNLYASSVSTESDFFEIFKKENSCWYEIEENMTNNSINIISFLKKFSTILDPNSANFWIEVNNKIKLRYPNYNFSECNLNYSNEENDAKNVKTNPYLNAWTEANPWFGKIDEMTDYALNIHTQLVEKGTDTHSLEYYSLIDEAVREKFPDYFAIQVSENSNNQESKSTEKKQYSLTILENKLILDGRVETGLYDEMKEILKENSSIKTIILKSSGGLVEEARKITDLIIDFELNTHAYQCYSVCSSILAAGNKRTLQRGYKVGFHRTYWESGPLEDYYEYYKDDYEDVFEFSSWVFDDAQDSVFIKLQYLIERGIAPLFAIKTLQAKSDGMWYPRRKELLNANFITE